MKITAKLTLFNTSHTSWVEVVMEEEGPASGVVASVREAIKELDK